ncbi:hypothetical protein V1525DRAFT_392987 [Lipomyces kononenkoae]|uniref:Uncharacterized protein n=1 Tax=Lipomyces kononenkoae TaxID=34357 RepID=A0ACC3TBS5_LIPKO
MDVQKEVPAAGLNKRYTERMLALAKRRLKEVDARLSLARSASITKSQSTLRGTTISRPIATHAPSTSGITGMKPAQTFSATEDYTQQERVQHPDTARAQVNDNALAEESGESSRSEQLQYSSHRSQYSHTDLLRQIEDQLMMENPLDMSSSSSAQQPRRPIGRNRLVTEMSQPESMKRSTSEPVGISLMTRSRPPSEFFELSNTSGAQDAPRTPVEGSSYQNLPEHGQSGSVMADMVNLLDEGKEFRRQVREIRNRLSHVPHETDMRPQSGSSPADRRAGVTSTVVSEKAEQHASPKSSPMRASHMSHFSLGSIVTDRSSFRPSRAQSVVLAYGGQQPSSVYIAPLQAEQIAKDIEEKIASEQEPISEEADLPAVSEMQHKNQTSIKQQYAESTIGSSNPVGGPKPFSLTDETPGLDIQKHRRGSSFSQRPPQRPRGPRVFSGASSTHTMRYSSNGSPRSNTPGQMVEPMPADSEPTTAPSIQGSSSKESSFSYVSATEYPVVPPELPKKNPVRPVGGAVHTTSNSSSAPQRRDHGHAQPEQPTRHRRHRRSNSASEVRQPTYSYKDRRKGPRPYMERVVSTPVYDKPRSHQDLPSWFGDDMMPNLSLDQPPGSEFDDIIRLGMEHKRMLEKLIETLGKLSVEVSYDEKKREEGRRRMDNAMLALEGWI